MADKDQSNDEYQFADLDAVGSEAIDSPVDSEVNVEDTSVKDKGFGDLEKSSIKRNALIVIAIIVVMLLLYKFVGAFFSKKEMPESSNAPIAMTTQVPVQPSPVVQPSVSMAPSTMDSETKEKISAITTSQQTMRSDIASIGNQLNDISGNLNTMVAKLTELNGLVLSLSAKVDAQSHEIERLMVRHVERPVRHVRRHAARQYLKYNIQAVIPGRAWLIATNGTTLTVREGTVIPGYGMVKLIDPNQGRITTSSGQIIKFSQADS